MKNSKTYRSQTVQQVDVSQMLSGLVLCHAYKLGLIGGKRSRCKKPR
jgi:hypothetical protein